MNYKKGSLKATINDSSMVFGLRNFNETYKNHEKKVDKLIKAIANICKAAEFIDYENIFDETISLMYQQPVFNYHIFRNSLYWQGRTKNQKIKELKTIINQLTRQLLVEILENNNLPKTYDTALYLIYYKPINKVMLKTLKWYIKDLKI